MSSEKSYVSGDDFRGDIKRNVPHNPNLIDTTVTVAIGPLPDDPERKGFKSVMRPERPAPYRGSD